MVPGDLKPAALSQLRAGYPAHCACPRCRYRFVAIDRYASDAPPGPRGSHPERWIEFYRDEIFDPDDRLHECPGCGEELSMERSHLD